MYILVYMLMYECYNISYVNKRLMYLNVIDMVNIVLWCKYIYVFFFKKVNMCKE